MLLHFRAKDLNILITDAQPKQFIFAVCLHFKKSLPPPTTKMPAQFIFFMCVVPTVPSVVLTDIFTHLRCSDEVSESSSEFLSQR